MYRTPFAAAIVPRRQTQLKPRWGLVLFARGFLGMGLRTIVGVVDRAFRFGLQVGDAASRESWRDRARRAEDLGFDTILIPDHVVDGLFSPVAALCSMADATSSIRVGTFV